MEGLIPMMFRSIKKNRIRSKYRCLSTGNAQTYNMAELYPFEEDHHDHDRGREVVVYAPPPTTETRGGHGHRRFASTGVGYGINGGGGGGGGGYEFKEDGYYGDANNDGFGRFSTPNNGNNKQQLKRFRSHRMFSCITGASY